MDVGLISLVLVVGLILLLAIGMPLGFASAVLALLVMVMKFEPTLLTDPFSFGEGLLTSNPGTGPLYILTQKIFDLLTEYVLISVPLFIFMASLLERSGVARAMYDSLDFWLSGVRGGIAIVTSLMAVFTCRHVRHHRRRNRATWPHRVAADAAPWLRPKPRHWHDLRFRVARNDDSTFHRPDHLRLDYRNVDQGAVHWRIRARFHVGELYPPLHRDPYPEESVARTAPGTKAWRPQPGHKNCECSQAFFPIVVFGLVAVLILRALVLTLTGMNANLDENKEPYVLGMRHHLPYLAGVAIAALFLALFVFGRERSLKGWEHGKGLVPPLTIIGIVLGSIYGGITGITEAAGMGAFAVFVIALLRGEASIGLLWDSLMRTLRSTGTIIWVTVGAATLSGAYTLAGGPTYIADLIVGAEMPTILVLLTMMLILLFMGAFMDWVGIVLLIIPVFLPIVKRLPIEEIGLIGQLAPHHVAVWFGVLFCMNMQVSFLSPPFGPAAFYLKSVAPAHISLTDIFRGFLPFIAVQLLALAVLLIWPSIVTLLL